MDLLGPALGALEAGNLLIVWLRGVDLNHRPLGYESARERIFNKLANADGPAKPRKEA